MPPAATLLLGLLLLPALTAPPPLPAPPDDGLGARVEEALVLRHRARSLEAHDLLVGALLADLGPMGPRAAAEAELAALLLTDLVRELHTWPELAPLLAVRLPWPREAPPRVVYLLDRLLAECWIRAGRPDPARGRMDLQGARSDWWIAGPFDNERGTGLDAVYPPEEAFDFQEPMPGKERPVRWRLNRARAHPTARVELHEMLRPREQAVAYAASAVRRSAAGPVVLRLSTTGAYKVFLNGEQVAVNKAERPLRPDQDRVLLHLSEGWNQLLLKLAVEEGGWAFEARFTDPDGRPAGDLELHTPHTAWPEPAPGDDAAALLAYVIPDAEEELGLHGHGEQQPEQDFGALMELPGAEELMARLSGQVPPGDWPRPVPPEARAAVELAPEAVDVLDAARDDPRAQRLLALYHLLVHPDDRGNLAMRHAAERATRLAPDEPLGWYLLARSHEPDGRSRAEIAVNDRLAALQQTLALEPDHVAALLDLAQFSRRDAPRPERADSASARALAAAPDGYEPLVLRAAVLDEQGRDTQAELLRRRAEQVPEAETRVDALLARARRERARGDAAASLALLEQAFARNMLVDPVADALIAEHIDRGDAPRALWATEHVLRARPVDRSRMRRSAALLAHTDALHLSRARELVARALDACPDDPGAWTQLADLYLLSELEGPAVLCLRRALELDPSDAAVRRHLEVLTAEPPEHFEDAYRWDAAELLELPLRESGNEPLEVLRSTVVWRVETDGTEHRYEHQVWRVLNEGGARALARLRLAAPPDHELQVHTLRVLRADGSVEYPQGPRRRGGNLRAWDLPALQPGDLVDLEFRVDQRVADVFGEYFGIRHAFYPDRVDPLAPTRRSELVVLAPPDVPLHVAQRREEQLESAMATRDDGLVERRWVARDLERPVVESAMPPREELAPLVDVTTFRDWDAFARWWWAFIEKEFVTTPAMREKVRELVAGTSSELEAIEAITRFVGQDIRYNAWAFGTHGYEPFSAATIFERRFGDCKDKSILLKQMLAEIGVEAWPVLIKAEHARAEEDLDVAMIGMFNHCIAYLPATEERDALYLDATADLNPLEYLRADDQGARVLHVTPRGGELHDIPYAPPEENALRRAWRVDLGPDGRAEIDLHDTSNGAYGVRLRTLYGGEQGALEARLGRELQGPFGRVDVLEASTSDLEDIGTPAELRARLVTRDLGSPEGGLRALPVRFDELPIDGLATESPAQRRHELVLDRPYAHEQELLYALPEGASVERLVEPVEVAVPGLLDYRLRAERSDEGLRVERSFRLFERRVPVERYAEFRDALSRVRQAEARRVLVRLPAAP